MACSDDDDSGKPTPAPTVPDVALVPLPTNVGSEAGPEPEVLASVVTIAVDIDPSVAVDTWTVDVRLDVQSVGHEDFTERQHELTIQAPEAGAGTLAIELVGTTTLSDGSPRKIGHRVVRTHFVPHAHRMVYLYVDPTCAFGGPTGETIACEEANESCYERSCRPEALDDLPDYREDWKTTPPSPCPSAVPEVRLGAGLGSYTDLKDGDEIPIECGPQGGHHLWLALRAKGLAQRAPSVTFSSPATDAGTSLTTSTFFTRLYESPDPSASTSCEESGVLFQLDGDGRSIEPFRGHPLDITMEVKDAAGQTAAITRRVQIAQKLSTTSCFSP